METYNKFQALSWSQQYFNWWSRHPIQRVLISMVSRRGSGIVCGALAAYLLLSPAYALCHFEEYAASISLLLRYVLIPGALALFFLTLALLARPQIAFTAGLCGLGVLGGLFLFEVLLTVRSVPIRLSILGKLSDTQSQAIANAGDVVRGFTLAQLNTASGVKELNKAALSGFPSFQVILCTGPDDVISYRADRYGFNNPDTVYKGNVLDAMLLGDSFVEGFCLRPGEDLASQLRRDGVSTVGVGIRGNGPLTELASLGRYGPTLKPRHVFMVFFEGNDWKNLKNELKQPWMSASLDERVDFGTPAGAGDPKILSPSETLDPRARPVTTLDLLLRTEVLRNFLALQQTFTLLGLNYPKATPEIPEFRRILKRASELAASWGGSFTLVYLPRVDRFMGAFSASSAFDPLRVQVVQSAASEAVPVIDLSSEFDELPNPQDLYAPDGHFNSAGAAFAAEVVAEHIRQDTVAGR